MWYKSTISHYAKLASDVILGMSWVIKVQYPKGYGCEIDHVDKTIKNGNSDARQIKFDQRDKTKLL
ncbi:19262_t:CDS:2 [Racocetra fulgida]|uniref:19262_t:CDS:1 n=1 Tax=Racocetra fulgida TaxID=60492 RepID=A0A9N8W334_9GLOM|nr:19262_t:CDS:2 [Racocetra fulgida]